jgi:uncharacterized protein (UPF0335 family)
MKIDKAHKWKDVGDRRECAICGVVDGAAGANSPCAGLPLDGASPAADLLRSTVERIERLEEEKRALADDIREVYAEAKATGFDTKVLRKIVAIRAMDPNDLAEQEALIETYRRALGMIRS